MAYLRKQKHFDGKVSIGTKTPVENFHLAQGDSDKNYLQFTNDTTGHTASDGISIGMGDDEALIIYQRESNDILFGTSATTRLKIDSGGWLRQTANTANNNVHFENSNSGSWGLLSEGGGGASGKYICKFNNYAGTQVFLCDSSGIFHGESSNNISDVRLKENIATVPDALTKIKALTGRTFTWKEEAKMCSGTHYGMIAQELEKVIPDLVYNDAGIRSFDKDDNLLTPAQEKAGLSDTDEWAKSIHMSGLIPVLVEAVKELSAKIDTLDARVTALEA